jgi:serine/threonine-protein kinase
VRKAGNRVWVTARLLEAAGGSQLWSQVFEPEQKDIFAVQDEIARAVAAALKVKLLPGRANASKELRTVNPEAYEQYLLGKQLHSQSNFDASLRASEAYNRALAIDPKFAPAWAGLATNTISLADSSTTSTAELEEVGKRALEYAEKAIALAPDAADGYTARGALRTQLGFDFTGGRRDLERALELNPNDTRAMHNLVAGVLLPLGRLPEGLVTARKAARLDPLDSGAWALLGRVQFYAGDLAAARSSEDRALQISPQNTWAEWTLAEIDLAQGKTASALARAEKFRDERNRLILAALAEQQLGHVEKSQQSLDAFLAAGGDQWAYVMAELFAERGDKDRAFEWLERARTQRDPRLKMIKVDPYLRALRDDPRYPAFLGKLNLPAN